MRIGSRKKGELLPDSVRLLLALSCAQDARSHDALRGSSIALGLPSHMICEAHPAVLAF